MTRKTQAIRGVYGKISRRFMVRNRKKVLEKYWEGIFQEEMKEIGGRI